MKYTVGVDFGTLSAWAVLVCVETGQVISQGECCYSLYKDKLPNGAAIPPEIGGTETAVSAEICVFGEQSGGFS